MSYIDDQQTQKNNIEFIRGSMRAPMLEKDHELDLARRWRDFDDEKSLHELVSSYTRLAISIATRFRNYGLPVGDLIQEANVGLMQAAMRFDPERDIRFSTYASWWIRAAVQDYVLRNWSIVRTGTTSAQKSLFFNLRRLRAKIANRPGHEKMNELECLEIANSLKVKVKDVTDMEARLSGGDASLNVKIGESGDQEWQNFIADDTPSPEEITIEIKDGQTHSKWLETAINTLPEREQKIIRERHLGFENVTLEKLGNELGVSKERVRQLEQRAMEKLKSSIRRASGSRKRLFN